MPTFTIGQLVDAFDDVLAATEAVARTLTEADGERSTDCPGWTVKDQVAHIVGLEQIIGGAPPPTVELPELAHVHGDVGRFMELSVHVRRGLPLVALVDELAGMRPRRVASLRALTDGGEDPMVPTPFGERPLSAALPTRVFDLWAHEQDIRRAMGMAARIDGISAAVSLDRVLAMWPRALPPATEGVDGELVIEVTGPEPSTTAITLGAGGPVATLRGDLGDVTRVFCGRIVPGDDLLTGDPTLVATLRPKLGMTP